MAGRTELARAVDTYIRKSLGVNTSDVLAAVGTNQVLIDQVYDSLQRGPALRNKARSANTWVGPQGVTGTLTLTADLLILAPLPVDAFQVYDQIGTEVTTAGAGGSPTIRSVLFADRGDGYPGKVVHAGAQIAAATTGFKGETGLSLVLAPGLYWVGVVAQGATTTQPTVRSVTDSYSPFVVQESNVGTSGGGYSQAGVTAAIPTDFTSTITVLGAAPRTLLRAK
jgi:hypothetical protein